MAFKKGDSVIVVGRIHGHQFNLGDVVKILHINNMGSLLCRDEYGEDWWMNRVEVVSFAGMNNRSMVWSLEPVY